MEIRIKNDAVEVEGYVNAIERKSKPMINRETGKKFVERICKGAFKRALERNDDIRILENHDWSRDLGGTKDGNLELVEDNIGLKAKATLTDPEAVKKAKRGDYIGWSFGFTDENVENHEENGMPTRDVKDLNLAEVSILDRTRNPAYEGNSIQIRNEEIAFTAEAFIDEINVRDLTESKQQDNVEIDYSKYETMIKELKNG